MMPPSTTRAAGNSAAMCRARSGAIALASTKTPGYPLIERATSSAFAGGQIDNTTSAPFSAESTSSNSRKPKPEARFRVAALRPADTHRTMAPPRTACRPTAAPIAPGCSSTTTVGVTPVTTSSVPASAD